MDLVGVYKEGWDRSKGFRRQGDVYIIPMKKLPEDAKEVDVEGERITLVEGEATGHFHGIRNRNAQLLAAQVGMFLILHKVNELTHDEHDPIDLPEGLHQVVRQREYDAKEIRYVAD